MADSLVGWLKDNLLGRSAAPAPAEDDSFRFQPGESTAHAMLRYGGNELLGAARSPLDLVKNLAQAPQAVYQGYRHAVPTLLRDPSLLTELPGVAWDAAKSLAMHPEELGSQLGQAVIGAKAPTLVKNLRGKTLPTHAEGLAAGAEKYAAAKGPRSPAQIAANSVELRPTPTGPPTVGSIEPPISLAEMDARVAARRAARAADPALEVVPTEGDFPPSAGPTEIGPYIGADEAGRLAALRRAAKGR